jgi:4-hydroxy-tetrahydrodipicolinate reductase
VTAELDRVLETADLLIDFTTPEATMVHAEAAARAKIGMVIGTTGFTPEQLARLAELSKQTALFWSPNMSIGIVIVRRAISSVSKLLLDFGLSNQTKAHLSETHHTKKKDKPSGTAKALAEELFKATGWLIKDEEIEAKREGEVIGLHSVTFDTGPEKITLTHEATDRRVFAQGAVLVARNFHKLTTQGKGWYTMDDFINAMQKVHVS